MSNIELIQLSLSDGNDEYELLQRIGPCENHFLNSAYGISREQFNQWLDEQDKWSKGIDLPEGYVPQTVYWLKVDGKPVGIGKIRSRLTESSKKIGGNIGYAIDPNKRGNGYSTILLKYLLDEARRMKVDEIMLTVDLGNLASKRAIEKCGGELFMKNEERWFFRF